MSQEQLKFEAMQEQEGMRGCKGVGKGDGGGDDRQGHGGGADDWQGTGDGGADDWQVAQVTWNFPPGGGGGTPPSPNPPPPPSGARRPEAFRHLGHWCLALFAVCSYLKYVL